MGLTGSLILFLGAAVVVVTASRFLAASGHVIAVRTGWGQVWVGVLLLAGATSLPELVATSTAALIGATDLAGGSIFGSNMVNMAILTVALGLFARQLVFRMAPPQLKTVALFATALTIIAVALAAVRLDVKWAVVSPASLIIIGCYVLASRRLFRESSAVVEVGEETASHGLRWGWTVFGLATGTIFVATFFLTRSAADIAAITGIGESFIGALGVAFVTSLPEVATTVSALRQGTPNMAISSVYGSNAFNVMVLAVADLFYSGGSLFGSMTEGAVAAGFFAIGLMVLGGLQLVLRRPQRRFSLVEPSVLTTAALYVGGLFVVFYIG